MSLLHSDFQARQFQFFQAFFFFPTGCFAALWVPFGCPLNCLHLMCLWLCVQEGGGNLARLVAWKKSSIKKLEVLRVTLQSVAVWEWKLASEL